VPKKDNKLRLCLDSKELNKEIQREHYSLPTIEEVATCLYGAKCFDARHWFWHIQLDEALSILKTFNMRFGCYQWKSLPFGISSALEVLKWKMQELIEGLSRL